MEIKNKSAQVTIFIIIALVIVAAFLLFFLLRNNSTTPSLPTTPSENPDAFLDTCLKEIVYEAIDNISIQGGSINPKFYRKFQFTEEERAYNVAYLCYQGQYFKTCVNQEPMLFNHLKGEIGEYIKDEVRSCWDSLGESLTKEGYVVDATYKGFEIEFTENYIIIFINGEFELTKNTEYTSQKDFRARVNSKFYSLASLAQEIVSQEARYCNFEDQGYELYYPKYEIDKFDTSDGERIYTLVHDEDAIKFRFAVRGCVIT